MPRYRPNPRTNETNAIVDTLLFDTMATRKPSLRLVPENTMVLADTSANPMTVSLPPADKVEGRGYLIKKTSGSHPVTLIPARPHETIDGQPRYTLNSTYASTQLIASQGKWWLTYEGFTGEAGGAGGIYIGPTAPPNPQPGWL